MNSSNRVGRQKKSVNYKLLHSIGSTVTQKASLDSISEDVSFSGEVVETFPVGDPSEMTEVVGEKKVDVSGERSDEVDESNSLDEKSKLYAYLRELEEKEEKLEEESEMLLLRKTIADKEKRVRELEAKNKGTKKTSGSKDSKKGGGMFNEVTLNSLRQHSSLKSKVDKELSKLGLLSGDINSDSDSDSDTDLALNFDSGVNSGNTRVLKEDRKSGIDAKISDDVFFRQKYPHASLRFDFVNEGITFNKLDLNLFVAGELEIISACKTRTERNGRINLLKRLMYLISSFEFSVIRSLYAAILREIEMGSKTWEDDFQFVETAVLSRHKMRNKYNNTVSSDKSFKSSSEDSSEEVWFCSKFQRNKCAHKFAHSLVVKGKMRLAKHICASCWLKDKKEMTHPECSSACPHTNE